MREVEIQIRGKTGDCLVAAGDCFKRLGALSGPGRKLIVTDANVARRHAGRLPDWPRVVIGASETAKSLETVAELYRAFMAREADRDTFVVGVGGGVVCDVVGFAAATYLRGLDFGFVATTLLAQVDAAVGGKNGVNFEGFKNMVGVIRQPRFVLCDPLFLETLPEDEFANGLAEVVKHALIADRRAFEEIAADPGRVLRRDPGRLARLVADAVAVKAQVVNRDEQERGLRRVLNFGHTVGHAIEAAAGVPHGRAVSMGMAAAAFFSVSRGLLAPEELRRITSLLGALGLPVAPAGDPQAVLEALGRDKKRSAGDVHLVLLEGIGRAVVAPVALDELRRMTADYLARAADGLPEGSPP